MATTTWNGFRITSTYLGNKAADWGGAGPKNYNNHKVTVSRGGKRTSFEFWASIMEPEIRGRRDLLSAFDCFLGDARSGLIDFAEFCQEFGYDEDSRRAEKVWKACQRSARKLERLGVAEDELYNTG